MLKEMAVAAANWWTQKIRNPTFDTLGPTRGRDKKETEMCGLAEVMATMVAVKDKPEDEKFNLFFEKLTEVIVEQKPRSLSVDYGPCATLSRVAAGVGIDGSCFPWKTTMWIDYKENKVVAKCGYGAQDEQVFPCDCN